MTPRRIIEVGLLISALGLVMIAIGAGQFLSNPSATVGLRQRWWTVFGASIAALGFVIQLAGEIAR